MKFRLKKLSLMVGLAAIGGVSGVASANDGPLMKPVSAQAENRQIVPKAAASALEASAAETNPFTGKAMSAEQSRRAADQVRAENQLLEERIRQINLVKDLESAPTKKKIELEKLVEQNKPKVVQPPAPAEPAGPKASVKVEPKRQVAPPPAPPAPPVPPPPPPPPPPELRGTIKSKDGVSAIIDNAGRTIIARPGEKTSLGRVEAVSENSASVGEAELRLRAGRVSRQMQTETTEPAATGAPVVAMPPGMPNNATRPAPTTIPAPPVMR